MYLSLAIINKINLDGFLMWLKGVDVVKRLVYALKFGKELPHLKDQFQHRVKEIYSLEYSAENQGGYITIGTDNNL